MLELWRKQTERPSRRRMIIAGTAVALAVLGPSYCQSTLAMPTLPPTVDNDLAEINEMGPVWAGLLEV